MLDEGATASEAAIRLAPDFAAAHWNCGYCYLLAGDFSRGWREHEWREAAGEVALDQYPQPRWNGESLAGRTILVHGEQGIGDEILFGSCLPDLIDARAIASSCAIRGWSRCSNGRFRRRPCMDMRGGRIESGCRWPSGSTCRFRSEACRFICGRSRDSFPNRERFLTADPAQVADWKNRYAQLGPGLKIGISWRAGGQPGERRMRTTSLDQWRELLSLPGATFVNLQYGDCVEDLAAVRRETGIEIHDWTDADPLVDMDAFAAKVAALDLVVSVDNSTVHLSGALGRADLGVVAASAGLAMDDRGCAQSLVSEFAAISPAAARRLGGGV